MEVHSCKWGDKGGLTVGFRGVFVLGGSWVVISGVISRIAIVIWSKPESWKVRSGTLGPETQSSNFPFWAVRHPAWSPEGGSLLVRSSKFTMFTPLGKHRISSAPQPRMPGSVVRLDRS